MERESGGTETSQDSEFTVMNMRRFDTGPQSHSQRNNSQTYSSAYAYGQTYTPKRNGQD